MRLHTIDNAGSTFKYADLNIRHTGNPERTLALVKRAIRMGYDTVVINIDIGDICPAEFAEDHLIQKQLDDEKQKIEEEEEALPPAVKRAKRSGKVVRKVREQTIPDPYTVDEAQLDIEAIENDGRRFRQFSRLTFTLNDATVMHNVFINPQLKKFDVIAVRPGDASILTTLTRKTDLVDIITFDHSLERNVWLNKGKPMEMLRVEGVGFEICYGPTLGGHMQLRDVLTNGRTMIRSLKKKGIVFSSAAESVIDLRAPVDVMNMLTLWGINGAEARKMISGNAKQILLRAEARHTVRGALHSTPLEKFEVDDGQPAIDANVPTKMKNTQDALRRLLSVKEFRAQIEYVSPEEGQTSAASTDTAMEG